jgi:hypothetical protein
MLRIKRTTAIGFLVMAALSCIRPFDPLIEADEENKYVVSGCITDEEGEQSVYISVSSPMDSPEYLPLSGCAVETSDNQGNSFVLNETETGKYTAWIGQEYLRPGIAYQVSVYTPSGDIITSAPDTMPQSPPIDSIYFIMEDQPTSVPSVNNRGLQFYADLDARQFFAYYYKWEVTETWEYHATHAKEYYYDGNFHEIVPPDSSAYFCWLNTRVKTFSPFRPETSAAMSMTDFLFISSMEAPTGSAYYTASW